jgi:photosystem II stability/assembly factor-like uncharacterized protein
MLLAAMMALMGAGVFKPTSASLLYEQDFEAGTAPEWDLDSGWSIINDGGNHVLSGTGHVWASNEQGQWGDHAFRFRVKINEGRLHANYRRAHQPNHRRYYVGLSAGQLHLSKQVGGTFDENLATASGLSAGWHTIEITGTGATIQVLVDDTAVMSYTDPDPLLSGEIAFESLDDSAVMVDDVQVWGQATMSPDVSWIRTGGPLGGLGYDIRVRPDNPDIMYVTDAWAGVHRSSDGGQTWNNSNSGIEARTGPSNDAIPVFCLTVDPNDNDIIWIGMQDFTGVYRSEDGGQTWVKRINGIQETFGLTIRGISIEPGNSNTVYIAGEVSSWWWAGQEMPGKEFDRTQGVVYKTTDAGLNWTRVWTGNNLARYVMIHPTQVNTLYVSTGIFDREAANSDPVTETPGGVGVIKSTDGGQTWFPVNNGLNNLYIGTLYMHPTDPDTLLAGASNNAYPAGGGVYLTTDGGANWTYKAGTHIESVEFAGDNPNVAYALGDGEFFYSNNRGQTWQERISASSWGPEGIRPGFPIDVQVDPRDADRILVNNYGGGNFLSEDGGQTWQVASTGYTGADLTDVAIHPLLPSSVYANGRSGPFVSSNGGITWRGMNPLHIRPIAEGARVAVDPANPAHLLMSSAHWGWTFESTDGGQSWELVTNYEQELQNLPWPDTNQKFQGMQAISFAPSDTDKVYGGFGVWRCATDADPNMCATPPLYTILTSADGGHTWVTQTTMITATVTEIVVHPTDANRAWAATAGSGVYTTTNGGLDWQAASNGLTDLYVMGLAINPHNPAILYAGTAGSGLFKSENGGASWQQSSGGMAANEPIGSIVVDPIQSNVVYAGSWFSGVFYSEDAGQTWMQINDGLRTRSVRALAISADGQVVYAGTRGEGVFRLGDIDLGACYLPVVLKEN